MGRLHDEDAVRAVETAYDDAWSRGDIHALMECLTDDAVLTNPRGETARGRREIHRLLGGFLAGEARGTTHRGVVHDVLFVSDDVAIVVGDAVIGGAAGDLFANGFTDTVVRRSGRWAIAHVSAYERRAPATPRADAVPDETTEGPAAAGPSV